MAVLLVIRPLWLRRRRLLGAFTGASNNWVRLKGPGGLAKVTAAASVLASTSSSVAARDVGPGSCAEIMKDTIVVGVREKEKKEKGSVSY